MINEQMKHFIKNSPLVHIKEEEFNGDKLYVVKYSRKVFYKALWSEQLEMLRGVVLDEYYNIVSNPFLKVFNYGENNATIGLDKKVLAVQKINGFMAAATYHKGKLLVSTSGTISSDFAKMAYEWIYPLDAYLRNVCKSIGKTPTFIFEICDPSDPHIVHENTGVYLLGMREKQWDSSMNMMSQKQLDDIADVLHVMRPYWRTYRTFQKLLDEVKTCKHEGYMAYEIEDQLPTHHYYDHVEPVYNTVKLKSPFYLVIKFLGRMGEKNSDILFEDPEKFKQKIDEEFYDIVDFIYKNKDIYLAKTKEKRIEYIREYFLGKVK